MWAVTWSRSQSQSVSSLVRKRRTAPVATLSNAACKSQPENLRTTRLSHMPVCMCCALVALWVWVSQLVRVGVLRAWAVPWVTSVWASIQLLHWARIWEWGYSKSTAWPVCGLTATHFLPQASSLFASCWCGSPTELKRLSMKPLCAQSYQRLTTESPQWGKLKGLPPWFI